jgi:phosphoenolpyruvate carboxykinase (GTP)
VDHIVARIELQEGAYAKEKGIPARLFEILAAQKEQLKKWKKTKGAVILPDDCR